MGAVLVFLEAWEEHWSSVFPSSPLEDQEMLMGGGDPAEGHVKTRLLCPQSLPLPRDSLTPF